MQKKQRLVGVRLCQVLKIKYWFLFKEYRGVTRKSLEYVGDMDRFVILDGFFGFSVVNRLIGIREYVVNILFFGQMRRFQVLVIYFIFLCDQVLVYLISFRFQYFFLLIWVLCFIKLFIFVLYFLRKFCFFQDLV